jgi:uncharacterized low-complexity protein
MSKKPMKPISLAIGAAFVTSLAASNVSAETNIDANPFAMSELSSGYMQLAAGYGGDKSDKEGKCGEGKCGEDKAKKEGTCGGKKADEEGKCGEGKCGANEEMKENMEGKCGGDKAEEEGKCGEGKCGESK